MADLDPTNKDYTVIRDANLMKNRIFVGNLPQCSREELESICLPYGAVLCSMVHRNYGFVQFANEDIANKVASALNKSTFKGNVITVRNAGIKKAAPQSTFKPAGVALPRIGADNAIPTTSMICNDKVNPAANSEINDCEIIVVDRRNTIYAEYIEKILRRINLRADVLFPNPEVPLGKVLANISSRGCLYAILVTTQHQEHRSITVNILHGQAAEHRNMPVDDAVKLIGEDFLKTRRGALLADMNNTNLLPKSVPIIPASNIMPPTLSERSPDSIRILLNLLANDIPLTVIQYDHIIKYLQSCRERQLKAEVGEEAPVPIAPPDPEIELQKRIFEILNKPSVASPQLRYSILQSVKDDSSLMKLLSDERVQKALDSLMANEGLVDTVAKYMNF